MSSDVESSRVATRIRRLETGVFMLRQRSWSGLTVAFYLLEGHDGLTLIDAGFPNRAEEVREALSSVGFRLEDVARVAYTHTHIDHMGGGPALAEVLTAEHLLWHESAAVAEDWQAHQRSMEHWGPWTRELVPEGPLIEAMRRHNGATRGPRKAQRSGPGRLAPTRVLRPGERVAAGAYRLEALPTPGHDPHHVILYDRDAKLAFSGDVVLPIETPLARPMGDDEATYLASLEAIEGLDIALAYPGHGGPITQWAKRVAHSRGFVHQRHERIRATLAEFGALTIYEVARHLAGPFAEDPTRFPLVLANIDSSVQNLVARGELVLEGTRLTAPT